MLRSLLYSTLLLSAITYTHATEIWAPGVSQTGGWVDYNKSAINDGVWADTAMCWAASSSNIIKWWMNNNPEAANAPENPWEVFRAVYENVGKTPDYALRWWIDGVTNNWGDIDTPDGYDLDGFPAEIENKENATWPYGAFLSAVYSTSANSISVAQNPNDSNGKAITLGILDALETGYALSLSVYSEAANFQVAHAITLWGAEYSGTGDERVINSIWITDSDDGAEQLTKYSINTKETAIAISSGTLAGSVIRYAAGMRTDTIPEPTSATLSLLALCGLAFRRRR